MSRDRQPGRGGGFTMVELLLAITLIGLMAGVVIFNFSSLLGPQKLEEGAVRVESLVRLAKAQSALQGKRIRLLVDREAGAITFDWESEPGKFTPYDNLSGPVNAVGELVKVVDCVGPGVQEGGEGPARIDFFPDGGGDDFSLELAPLDEGDARHARVTHDAFQNEVRGEVFTPGQSEESAPSP